MLIDQANPNGTRPNSPAGAKPATADAAVLGLSGILVNLQSHLREQNPGPQAETREAGGESSQTKPNQIIMAYHISPSWLQ
jgi:hypothetical protein